MTFPTNLRHTLLAAFVAVFAAGTLPLHAQTPTGGAGSRPVAVLFCQYSTSTNTYGSTPAGILTTWIGNTLTINGATVDNSINGMVQEASEGTVNLQGTQAFGWYTLPKALTDYLAINTSNNAAAAAIAVGNDCITAAQNGGVNLAPFTYVAVYVNDSLPFLGGASWTANLPTPSPTTWNALAVSAAALTSPPLVVHELGHILSNDLVHTDSGSDPLYTAWQGSSPYLTPVVTTSVSPGWDASRRELMGFIPTVATFTGGTQTYNLSRLTQPYPGLPAAIDVPLPNGAKYVISARTHIGHDALPIRPTDQSGFYTGPGLVTEGVRIELFTSTTVDAHIETSAAIQSSWDAGSVFLTGQTFTDGVNNIAITVVNFNATGNPTAQIMVTSTTPNILPPGSWQTQPGSLAQISAASDGTVMGVNGGNSIYQWTAQGWIQLPGAATNIAVVNANNAFAWNGNALYQWNGTAWSQYPTFPQGVKGFTWLSAVNDGTLYAVDTTGNVNRLDAFTGAWTIVGSNAGHIAAQTNSVFYMLQNGNGSLPAGTIQMVSGTTTTTLPGNLIDISVDSAGDLWGVNGSSNVYHWNGTNWDIEPGTFTQIAVGNPSTLWAINANAQGAISQWH